jgi:putative FmdB family regulatory protein
MAAYTFRCRTCGEMVSVEHAMSDPHPTHHEGCGGELGRIFDSQSRVVYRTNGFTVVDKRFDINPHDE